MRSTLVDHDRRNAMAIRQTAIAAGMLIAFAAPAAAQDVSGTWLRDTGASKVRFAKCGEAMCGTISWLKDPSGPAKLGQRIFYDMKPNGTGKWSGSAFNPEDGKTYSGTMSLAGDTLTTAGCVFGGMICRTVKWSRSN
jgi:uncharacterized protein (DUF2147 family)